MEIFQVFRERMADDYEGFDNYNDMNYRTLRAAARGAVQYCSRNHINSLRTDSVAIEEISVIGYDGLSPLWQVVRSDGHFVWRGVTSLNREMFASKEEAERRKLELEEAESKKRSFRNSFFVRELPAPKA